MTPTEMIIKRTGMSSADASYYEALAEARIRKYLNLPDTADVTVYLFQIVDIACLLYQQDKSTQNSLTSIGYESHSFSEGGVSESVTGMTGQKIWDQYSQAINDVLATLDNERPGVVRFL